MEELWSKRFDEEVDYTEEEPMSRKAKREREQSVSPILSVTVIFLALLIILPISAYAWFSNREDLSEDPTSPSIEQPLVVNDDEEELEEEAEEEPVEDESEVEAEPEEEPEVEETASQPQESQQSSPPPSETTSNEPASSNAEQSSPEETQQSEQASAPEEQSQPEQLEVAEEAEYYTVQAGDNMYRVALNHGMTTQELMQLNNISDETVFIGQELRVK